MKVSPLISDDYFEREYAKWERGLRPIEVSLQQKSARELYALKKAGVDPQRLLGFLVLIASGNDGWKNDMRSQRDALLSTARRMEILARDAENQAKDPLCQMDAWIALLAGRPLGMEFPKPWIDRDPCAALIIAGMRAWAKVWKREAQLLGRYLRSFAQTDSGIVLLLLYVWSCTAKNMHFEELAWLLTEAFKVAGKDKNFSADGLRKIFKRHVPRLVRLAKARMRAQATRNIPPVLPGVSIPR
jgi:hypothetical protein